MRASKLRDRRFLNHGLQNKQALKVRMMPAHLNKFETRWERNKKDIEIGFIKISWSSNKITKVNTTNM